MRDKIRTTWRVYFYLNLLSIGSLVLAGCNYPTKKAVSEAQTATNQITTTATSSTTPLPSATPTLNATSTSSNTPGPSDTPVATATIPLELAGVVILNGNEIGTIQKIGEEFQYIPNPGLMTPEVKGKVVLQIKDPARNWGYDLENSSSPLYNIKHDPRPGWENYGVLVAYEGRYEIAIRFIALNPQTGEKIKSRVWIEIVGATVLATETPEVEIPLP
jgi:hypothetical protein